MSVTFQLERCQLCDNFAVLRDSHIAPNFMERYVKSISLTKQFTHSSNFNLDSQSAYKERFLCFHCEQKFSVCEAKFAKNIFWPSVKDGDMPGGDSEWLRYFLVSITWRFGRFHERKQAKRNKKCEVCTSSALQSLRDFLLGYSSEPGAFAPQLFYSRVEICAEDDVEAIEGPTPLLDYITRCYEQIICIKNDGSEYYIYIKLPHFAIWHAVQGPEWIVEEKHIKELAANQSIFYSRKQATETTQITRDRRDKIMRKKTAQELEDFYNSPMGDNVRRAQQFMHLSAMDNEQ